MFQETAKVLLALMIGWLASAGEELPGEGVFLPRLPEWSPHGKF